MSGDSHPKNDTEVVSAIRSAAVKYLENGHAEDGHDVVDEILGIIDRYQAEYKYVPEVLRLSHLKAASDVDLILMTRNILNEMENRL